MDSKKICSACQFVKSTSEFHKNQSRKDGLQNQCKECHAQSRKDSYFRHRDIRIKNQVQYNRNRYHNDEKFRIARLLRSRLNNCLKEKHNHTFEYLGCSIDGLYLWLEFTKPYYIPKDYTGELHLDHFKPIKSFDLTIERNKYLCFNWLNLRWMTADQNLRKSGNSPSTTDKLKMLILNRMFREKYNVTLRRVKCSH